MLFIAKGGPSSGARLRRGHLPGTAMFVATANREEIHLESKPTATGAAYSKLCTVGKTIRFTSIQPVQESLVLQRL